MFCFFSLLPLVSDCFHVPYISTLGLTNVAAQNYVKKEESFVFHNIHMDFDSSAA